MKTSRGIAKPDYLMAVGTSGAVEDRLEDGGFVVLLVFRPEQKRYRTVFTFPFQDQNRSAVILQLFAVSLLKFNPSSFIMSEPFPELSAWRNVLQPQVHARLLFTQTARPKPINENSFSILLASRLVDSFDVNAHVVYSSPI